MDGCDGFETGGLADELALRCGFRGEGDGCLNFGEGGKDQEGCWVDVILRFCFNGGLLSFLAVYF